MNKAHITDASKQVVKPSPTAPLPFRGLDGNRFALPWKLDLHPTSYQQILADYVARHSGGAVVPRCVANVSFQSLIGLGPAGEIGNVGCVTDQETGARIVSIMNALRPINPDIDKIIALNENVPLIQNLVTAYQELAEAVSGRPECAVLEVAINDTHSGIGKKEHGRDRQAQGWYIRARRFLKESDKRPSASMLIWGPLDDNNKGPGAYWTLRNLHTGQPLFIKQSNNNPVAMSIYGQIIEDAVALYPGTIDPALHIDVVNRLKHAVPVIRDRFGAYWNTEPKNPDVLKLRPLHENIMHAVDKLADNLIRIFDPADRVTELIHAPTPERSEYYKQRGMRLRQLKLYF